MSDDRFELVTSPTARRQLTDRLAESVAFAAYELIIGPLLDNPHRVGKRLGPPLEDRHSTRRGTYRIIY
ncbi:MAG: type II toxin-antitoxin system RelE/ParE family toxin [Dermatophilaceae bacterium]